MNKSLIVTLFGIAVATLLSAAPAQAQATRTWISGVGDDVNPCSRTAPCKTFPGAISKTATGGEIDTLDPGGFGAVTVTKSITLANEGIGEAGILVAGTNGITVNCTTDPNCVVVVRGLQIDGGPIGSNSLNGIRFYMGKALMVQNCVIRNFTSGSPNGFGIAFTPSTSAQLDVTDTTITTDGQPGAGGGILIQPTGSPLVKGVLKRVNVINNTSAGLLVDTTSQTGGNTTITVSDSVFSNNGDGVSALGPAAGRPVLVMLNGNVISNNGNDGIVANGTQATVRVGSSVITKNGGIGVDPKTGGAIISYGNNQLNANATDGTFSSTVPLQ